MMTGMRMNELLEAFYDGQKDRSGAECFCNDIDGIEVRSFGTSITSNRANVTIMHHIITQMFYHLSNVRWNQMFALRSTLEGQ